MLSHEWPFSVSYVPHFDWPISVDMTIKMTDCELEVSRQYLVYLVIFVVASGVFWSTFFETLLWVYVITLHYITYCLTYLPYIFLLRYGTLRYDTLRYVTLRYVTVRYVEVRFGTLRYGTLRYGMLRYVTLRYVTIHYATLRYVTLRYVTVRYVTVRYVTLWYVTVRYVTVRCFVTYTLHIYYIYVTYYILHIICYVHPIPPGIGRGGGGYRGYTI